jgi:branched-subunit amino acid transport protein AzlD
MIDIGYGIITIAVVAVCTVLMRAVPFMIFGGKRSVPVKIRVLGKFLPSAIMATLVIYCLRGINLSQGNHGVPEIIASLLVVILHSWKKNILLSVSIGTVCYMLMIQYIFI